MSRSHSANLKLLLTAPLMLAAAEGSPSDIVPLDAMIAPVIDGDRVAGVVRVALSLSSERPGLAERLAPERPRITEACLAAVIEEARVGVDLDRPVNAPRLAVRLQSAIDKALPSEQARVLLIEVSTRRG
jgi:hypothetical protein